MQSAHLSHPRPAPQRHQQPAPPLPPSRFCTGTGAGGFRGDCERWPGGGVSDYMKRVTEEIVPLVQQRYGASEDPAKVAFGGGSFGGVCALYAAMHYPHIFGK